MEIEIDGRVNVVDPNFTSANTIRGNRKLKAPSRTLEQNAGDG
jgi:hypothetical protein